MILTRWQATLSVVLVAMLLLCLAVWAGVRGCDPPTDDDDDSADDDVFEELDAEFSDPDETYSPGVL
jgi:hypothetical protein